MGKNPDRSILTADAALLRSLLVRDLRERAIAPAGARLLMLAGLPGSGKTTLAREVALRHPFLVLESDRLRKTLVPRPEYSAIEHRRVFRACHRLIDEFLGKGYPVMVDATNLNQRSRKPILSIASRHHAPAAIAVVVAPAETVKSRLADREAGLDPGTWSDAGWEIYARMVPAWQEVGTPHFVVDTSADIAPVVDEIVAWAKMKDDTAGPPPAGCQAPGRDWRNNKG